MPSAVAKFAVTVDVLAADSVTVNVNGVNVGGVVGLPSTSATLFIDSVGSDGEGFAALTTAQPNAKTSATTEVKRRLDTARSLIRFTPNT